MTQSGHSRKDHHMISQPSDMPFTRPLLFGFKTSARNRAGISKSIESLNMTKLMTSIVAVALLAGCASQESYEEDTRHYRSSERFAHVAIDVNFDIDLAEVPAEFSDLPGMVEVELIHYLGQHGVEVSAAGSTADNADHARLDVTLQVEFRRTSYDIAARLTDVDGAVIDETTLYHRAGISSPLATAQQLAEVIADDMLMIWHPATSVIGEKFPSTGAARYALLPFGTEVNAEEQTSRFNWESFPSERMLQGASFSTDKIENVVYEFRLIQSQLGSRGPGPKVMYRSVGLTTPEHTLPFTLPSCERLYWSVRARFDLYGVPRVTEWSDNTWSIAERRRQYSHRRVLIHQTGGKNRGIYLNRDVPASVDCEHWDQLPRKVLSRLDLNPLQSGQSIGAIALVSELCDEDGCESRMSTQEASEGLTACLAEEFEDNNLNVPVQDIARLMADLPISPDTGMQLTDSAVLFTYLGLQENKDYLDSHGIRYVVTADMSIEKTGSGMYGDTAGIVTVAVPKTQYVAAVDSNVFDVLKGKVSANIGSTAKGSKGAVVPIFVILPVGYFPYGSEDKIQNRACRVMARRLSFALRGGVSGWPEGFFEDVYAPRWEHDGE